MKQTLHLEFNVEVFQLEEMRQAEALPKKEESNVYALKTIGKNNWLEHGSRCVDALGLVVLPGSIPDMIAMSDDEYDVYSAEENDNSDDNQVWLLPPFWYLYLSSI